MNNEMRATKYANGNFHPFYREIILITRTKDEQVFR